MASTTNRRGWVALCAIAAIACGGHDEIAAGVPHVATSPSPSELAALPPPDVEDVPGAAPTVGGELPEDIVPLSARITPRRVEVPSVRAGRAAGFTFDGSKRGWVVRLPEASRQHLLTPTFGGGHVYVGGGFGSNRLYAVDASSGRIDWMAAAPDGGPSAAILEDDKVLFNTESCTLFALDAASGRLRWSRWLGDPLMSQPSAANGRVFSGHVRDGQGFGFTAMDVDTGRVLWSRHISADVMNAAVLDDESAYFTTMDGVVWRFDQRTGRRVWRRSLRATSAPWLMDGALHVARRASVDTEDGARRGEQAVVLSTEDGSLLREHEGVPARFVGGRPDRGGTEAGWAYEGSRPTIVDGRLYQTIGSEVQSRDASTGELLWRRRYTHEVRHRPASPPAVAGGQLVFGTRDGVLYGLDIDTGMTTFAYDVGSPIAAQPTVAGGWVYATTTRGDVLGLEIADASMGGWHMWGGDARHNGPVDEPPPSPASDDDDGGPTEGTLRSISELETGELAGFPLESTDVHARVSEFVARVTVEQTFTNPYERAIEAVYLFPLPDDAAVDAMELRVGERTIRGQIRERTEAVREYRAARERGALASLLEQERPNLFRQSVANLPPGESIRVVLRYTQALPYEEGSYRFAFPMVAGPQYEPTAGEANEGGATPLAELGPGEARQDTVHLSVEAALGGTLRDVTSPTHAIDVERLGDRSARVSLNERTPDRDLELRFAVAGDEPGVSVLANARADRDTGYLSMLVHPRLDVPEGEITPRELVVVLDTSSSMRGLPFELAKATALRAIAGLRPTDTFRVVRFSDRANELSPTPLAASRDNVERARELVASMTALGSTEMRRGIHAALAPPIEDGRLRVVMLMTDGYVGNEAEVLREVNAELGHSRVFAFGVGAVVNRFLLTRLSELGRGDLSVVTPLEDPEEAADAFVEKLETPYLTDVRVDWGELAVSNVYPRRVPDLYADRPLVLHGRYAHGGRGRVTIRARIAGRPFEQTIEVSLPETGEARPELESLWARSRIRDLMTEMALRPSDALREEVTQLGLEHSLMTQWTAFVAIDDDGALPTGIDYGGEARHIGAGGGFGLIGYGVGGGGTGEGTVGLGVMGTIGTVSGSVNGAARMPAPMPRIRVAAVRVVGGLGRDSIRRVVRRQMGAIRFCYERRLAVSPELEGRLTVGFVIAPNGAVVSATARSSTLDDEPVESCVVDVFRRLRFAEVDGGGVVSVNYPLVFDVPETPPYAPGLPRPLPEEL